MTLNEKIIDAEVNIEYFASEIKRCREEIAAGEAAKTEIKGFELDYRYSLDKFRKLTGKSYYDNTVH